MATYRLMLEISDERIAEMAGVRVVNGREVRDDTLGDLLWAIRDFGEVVKVEVIEHDAPEDASE